MAVDRQDEIIRKLKKQIALLKKREEKSRREVKAALCQAGKVGKMYKNKLEKQTRVLKNKLANVEAAAYMKAAADLERSLVKQVVKTIKKSDLAKMVNKLLGVKVNKHRRGKSK